MVLVFQMRCRTQTGFATLRTTQDKLLMIYLKISVAHILKDLRTILLKLMRIVNL